MLRGHHLQVFRVSWILAVLCALPLAAMLDWGGRPKSADRIPSVPPGKPAEPRATSSPVTPRPTAVAGRTPTEHDSATPKVEPPSTFAADRLPPQYAYAREEIQHIQGRLHALGATYLLLETWQEDQPVFRFCCDVTADAPRASTGSPTRRFETTAGDPLAAMQQVLDDVEAWRAG